MLTETTIAPLTTPMPDPEREFVRDGRERFSTVDCFDFVPSNYELVWQTLAAITPGRFCEWGSGFGIVTGLAEMLGFQSCGIESDPGLAAASRSLLLDFELAAPIITGDYLECDVRADVYFVYCWPGMIKVTENHFENLTAKDATLLICFGQSQILCKRHADQSF